MFYRICAVILVASGLSGCGDSYPESGKVIDIGNEAKNISGGVYKISKTELDNWKSFVDTKNIKSVDVLSKQKIVNEGIALGLEYKNAAHLYDGKVDLNKFANERLASASKTKKQYEEALAELNIEISDTENKVNELASVGSEIELIRGALNKKISELEDDYRSAVKQNISDLSDLSKKSLGLKESASDLVASGEYFQSFKANSSDDCQSIIKSKLPLYQKGNERYYFVAEKPVAVNGASYCVYVKNISANYPDKKKAFISAVSDSAKKNLLHSATKKVEMYEGRKALQSKIKTILVDHADIKHKVSLLNEQKQKLQQLNSIKIMKAKEAKSVPESVEDVLNAQKRYLDNYLLVNYPKIVIKKLYGDLELVSAVQPDGFFKVSDAEYHLVVFDTGSIHSKFGLLRKEQFKNQNSINLSYADMFTIDKFERVEL